MTSIKIKAKSNAFSAERREGHSTRKATRRQSFFQFMQDEIKRLEALDRIRTSETYAATFRSICSFRSGKDFTWDEINEEEAIRYESYLKRNGKSMNTVSFYMRIFRAVYNRAVEKGLTADLATLSFQACVYRSGEDPQTCCPAKCHQATQTIGTSFKFLT